MITKIYTDLEQSKKLAEILPLESADMWWDTYEYKPRLEKHYHQYLGETIDPIPCWSLSALLAQMPCSELVSSQDNKYRVFWKDRFSEWHDNAVDACVELIERVRKEEEQ